MPVMRSVFYTPSNNEKMVAKAPEIACDILTLDLEDSVPPAEKQRGREMIQQYLKSGREKQLSPTLYVRVNNWETQMTNDDLEAIVHPGLDGDKSLPHPVDQGRTGDPGAPEELL